MAEITYLSLFSGCAGLDLGLRIALPETRCLGYVEVGIEAAEILAARIEEGSLDDAPIWSDISTFPAELYCDRLAGVCGGFPCQDLSVAGKRAGLAGKRSGLWGEYERIIRITRPGWVFIENVAGLVSSLTLLHRPEVVRHLEDLLLAAAVAPPPRDKWLIERHHERLYRRLLREHGISALLYVQCGLERLGYRTETGLFSAAEVGASHKRERCFILAYRPGARLDGTSRLRQLSERSPLQTARSVHEHGELADTAKRGRGELRQSSALGGGFADGRNAELGYADGAGGEAWHPVTGGTAAQERDSDTGRELGHAAGDDEQRDTVPGAYREGIETGGSGGIVAYSARDERPGPHGQTGPRRRVREAGDELADTGCAGRAARRIRSGEAQAGEVLDVRPGDSGNVAVADTGDGLLPLAGRRQEGRTGTRSAGAALADSECARRETAGQRRHLDSGSEPETRGRELADTERAERRPLDEPGGYRGEGLDSGGQAPGAAGSDSGALGNADFAGLEGRHQQRYGAGERAAGTAGDSGVENADGWLSELDARPGWPGPGETSVPGTHPEPRGSGADEELADTDGERRQQVTGSASGDKETHGRARRLECEPDSNNELTGVSADGYPELPLFAPGPGATELWQRILRERPELAPAISTEETESLLRRIFNERSDELDFTDRTDRLRAIGNMVCPLQASVAFTVLARRAGLT